MDEAKWAFLGALVALIAISIGAAINPANQDVMTNGLAVPVNKVSVKEYQRGANRPPILNAGKRPLPCGECMNYVLTDYRDSPTVFGPNGLYRGHFRGDEFIFDKPPTMENMFSKTPPPPLQEGW